MSFLANRNVRIFNSTMSVSTLNTSAMAISTLTGSTMNASSINVSTLSGSTITASTMTGNQITISTLTVSSINNGAPGVAEYSTLNVSSLNATSTITTSTLSVSTMTGSTLTISMLTGLIISVSSITSSDLVLSTLTVSSINGLPPGAGGSSGGGAGNVSVGTTVFSTLGVSSLNATSTITTSTMIATGNVGIGSNTPNAPLDVAGQIRTATTATNCIVAMTSGNGSFGSIESFNLGNTSKLPIALNAYGGNIGIGKTNPSQILDVAGAINCTSFLVNGTAVATGSGSVWGVNGSTAYYTSGSVGIGTITPSQRLHVFGDGARIMAESNTGSNAVVQMKTNANTSYLFTDQNGTLQMYADTGKNVAFMNSNNVGIGITNPSVPLHVNGMTYVQGPTVSTTTTNIVGNFGLRISQLTSTQLVVGQIVGQMCFHGWTRPYASAFIRCITDSTNGYDDAGALVFGTSNGGLGASETVRISENGFVGIGTATPSHRLQVAGAINCTSFLVNGVAVATGTGSVWGVNGSSAYYTSGNVGIGTASPSSPFHVYAPQSTVWPILINYSSGIQIVMGNGGSSTNFLMDTYNSTTGGRPALCLNTSGGFVGIGTTAPAYPTTISNSGFINLEINRTGAGTNYGSGIVHSLTSSTGTFRGEYAYAYGGATTIATTAQTQAYGYYAIDLANAGVFGTNAGGLTSSYFFMTTSSACFTKTNVGIGTASTGNKLSVYSTTANDGILFRNAFNSSTGSIALYTTSAAGNFIIDGTADAGVVLPADGKDLFLGRTTSLYTSMVVKGGTGYVGIGVAGPSYALDVAGFARATSGLIAGNGTGAVSLQLLDLPTASWQITTGGYNLSINNNSSSWTNRFTISETGNVGIGVAAPATRLHTYQGTSNIIRMQSSGVDNAYIVATPDYVFLSANYSSSGVRENQGRGSSQIVLYQPTAGGIITFNTSPSINTDTQERMRIASNGNILMNTPSSFGANGMLQITSSGGTTQDGISCRAVIDGNFIFSCHNTAGTFRGGILGANASSVTFATSSDRRLKDNIHPIEGSLSIVNQLKPVHFRWKNDDQYDFGFIAQDVYKVLPHLRSNFSSYIKDCSCQKNDLWNGIQCDHCISMNDEPVDEEGNPKYYSLDYGKFSPYLIGAVKELTERNTYLESENTQLKSQVTSLSASHASLLAWAQTQGFVQ